MSSLRQGSHGHVHASSTSSFHSVSLSSDGGSDNAQSSSPLSSIVRDHVPDSPSHKYDRESFDDSYSLESVSSVGISLSSPSSALDRETEIDVHSQRNERPSLIIRKPKQPSISPSPPSASSSANPPPLPRSPRPLHQPNHQAGGIRRVAPPPPLRHRQTPTSISSRSSLGSTTTASSSDRSSTLSSGTIISAQTSIGSPTQLLRPTPVPGIVRKRYEVLFYANLNAQQRLLKNTLSPTASGAQSPTSPSTPRKGWRGLSVDLITNPEEYASLSASEKEEDRLDGRIVRVIWLKSKLSEEKLKDIW